MAYLGLVSKGLGRPKEAWPGLVSKGLVSKGLERLKEA
jgi:hypothetical protein